jgi:hypothetical protein
MVLVLSLVLSLVLRVCLSLRVCLMLVYYTKKKLNKNKVGGSYGTVV